MIPILEILKEIIEDNLSEIKVITPGGPPDFVYVKNDNEFILLMNKFIHHKIDEEKSHKCIEWVKMGRFMFPTNISHNGKTWWFGIKSDYHE